MKKDQKNWIKILVPLLILVSVSVIWFVKADPFAKENPQEPIMIDGSDFSLHAIEEIDFASYAEAGFPLIVDYGATECIPCKAMAPVLEKLNAEMAGKAFIKFVDVWKYPEAAGNVPVQIIPTQFFFNADGTPFVPSEHLQSHIEFIMYVDSEAENANHVFTAHQGGLTEEDMREILTEMGGAVID